MPAPISVSVCVRNLVRRYGSVEALRGISFEVSPGEIFGLLGPNGAGKTTALECVLGLRRPDSGSVLIAGIDALARPGVTKELVGAQIQAATLQDRTTPRKVLRLFAAFYRNPAPVEVLIEKFGLSEAADARFDSLSGGQRQRLFLALAFVNNPGLVVLDEPTAGLDPRSRRELHDIIVDMRRSGRTVLLSTHDLDEAHRLCDRIGILDRGMIVATSRPDDLIAATAARSSVVVRTVRPLDPARLASLAGVESCRQEAGRWILVTSNTNETLFGLARCVELGANEFVDLQVIRPSLEEVFLSLTGRPWADSTRGEP